LLTSTEEAFEHTDVQLIDWDVVEREAFHSRPNSFTKYMSRLVQKKPLCWVTPLWHAFSEEAAATQRVIIALSFQEAHARAQAEVPKYFAADDALDNQVQQQVARESSDQCRRAAQLLACIPADIVEMGKSELLARKLLHLQQDRISHVKEKGLLTASEAADMDHQIQHAREKITHLPKEMRAVAHSAGPAPRPGYRREGLLSQPESHAADHYSGY